MDRCTIAQILQIHSVAEVYDIPLLTLDLVRNGMLKRCDI